MGIKKTFYTIMATISNVLYKLFRLIEFLLFLPSAIVIYCVANDKLERDVVYGLQVMFKAIAKHPLVGIAGLVIPWIIFALFVHVLFTKHLRDWAYSMNASKSYADENYEINKEVQSRNRTFDSNAKVGYKGSPYRYDPAVEEELMKAYYKSTNYCPRGISELSMPYVTKEYRQ